MKAGETRGSRTALFLISMENIGGIQICCLRCDIQGIQNFCVKIYENPPFPLPNMNEWTGP